MAIKALMPDASTTLLRGVADSQYARLSEFYVRHQPMMAMYLSLHFLSFGSDDIIQETFAAIARALQRYAYNPKETGHFRNYLTGVFCNKAHAANSVMTWWPKRQRWRLAKPIYIAEMDKSFVEDEQR